MSKVAKRRVLIICGLIGIIAVALVVLSAHAAEVRCDNNELIKQNVALQGEIDNLGIDIKAASSVDHIEEVASKKLGMVYPEESNCVYLSDKGAATANLAMTIKENAYN